MPVLGGVVAWVGAVGYVLFNRGFGASDLAAFGFWCAVLAVFLAGTIAGVGGVLSSRRAALRSVLAAVLGAFLGVLFTVAIATAMGGLLLAFSFPVGLLWIAGSALAFLGATLLEGRRVGSLARGLVVLGLSLGAVVALPFVLAYGSMYIWGRATHEVFELEAGFSGPVIVVYEVADAEPLLRADGAYRITVPGSGIVLTSSSRNSGWKSPEVYFRDGGERTPVPADWPHANDSITSTRTYWLGSRGRVTVNGVPEPFLDYQAFGVSTVGADPDVRARNEQLLDSLTLLYGR